MNRSKSIILAAIALLAIGATVLVWRGASDEQFADSGLNGEVAGLQQSAYQKISQEEAKQRMESEQHVLLDVRTREEFAEGHINGAKLMPEDTIVENIEAEVPEKGTLIFVYCRSGVRSARAAQALVEMGYTNVYDMGGIADWPYDVATGCPPTS